MSFELLRQSQREKARREARMDGTPRLSPDTLPLSDADRFTKLEASLLAQKRAHRKQLKAVCGVLRRLRKSHRDYKHEFRVFKDEVLKDRDKTHGRLDKIAKWMAWAGGFAGCLMLFWEVLKGVIVAALEVKK